MLWGWGGGAGAQVCGGLLRVRVRVINLIGVIHFSCGQHGKVSMIETLNSRLWDHRCKWWVCKKKEEFRLFSPVNVRLQSQSDDTICFILNVPEAHQLCISLVPEMRLWSTPRCDSSALINPPKTGLTVMKTSTILILCKVCVHWSSLGKHPAKDGDIRGKSYSFTAMLGEERTKSPSSHGKTLNTLTTNSAAAVWNLTALSVTSGPDEQPSNVWC